MRVLRALFGRVVIGLFGQVFVAELVADILARRRYRLARHARRVRTDISDKRRLSLAGQVYALV